MRSFDYAILIFLVGLAVISGAGYVAQAVAGSIEHSAHQIEEAR
jgi:hypothetical protein